MSVTRRPGGGYTENVSPAILYASLGGRGAALLLLLVQLLEVFAFVLFGELCKEMFKRSNNISKLIMKSRWDRDRQSLPARRRAL